MPCRLLLQLQSPVCRGRLALCAVARSVALASGASALDLAPSTSASCRRCPCRALQTTRSAAVDPRTLYTGHQGQLSMPRRCRQQRHDRRVCRLQRALQLALLLSMVLRRLKLLRISSRALAPRRLLQAGGTQNERCVSRPLLQLPAALLRWPSSSMTITTPQFQQPWQKQLRASTAAARLPPLRRSPSPSRSPRQRNRRQRCTRTQTLARCAGSPSPLRWGRCQ